MKLCDLHTHSVFSDGTLTPSEIVRSALSAGLCSVALCDHNTVSGLPEFLKSAEGEKIEAVAGCEFSVDLNGTELHLLALYIGPEHFGEINSLMSDYLKRKERSNRDLIDALCLDGFLISYERIKEKSPNGVINRANIAAELVEKGCVGSVKEAFGSLLKKGGKYYTEPKRISVYKMLEFISSIGAIPVLAHPFLNLDELSLEKFLPEAKKCGLVGIECMYSLYDRETTEASFGLAKKFGLLPSGGSDFHGANKPDIALGKGKGNLQIPQSFADSLKSLKN